MMNKIGSAVTAKVLQRITGTGGVNAGLAGLTQAEREFAGLVDAAQVRVQNVSPELTEKSLSMRYPAINIYCETLPTGCARSSVVFRNGGNRGGTAAVARPAGGLQDRLECTWTRRWTC